MVRSHRGVPCPTPYHLRIGNQGHAPDLGVDSCAGGVGLLPISAYSRGRARCIEPRTRRRGFTENKRVASSPWRGLDGQSRTNCGRFAAPRTPLLALGDSLLFLTGGYIKMPEGLVSLRVVGGNRFDSLVKFFRVGQVMAALASSFARGYGRTAVSDRGSTGGPDRNRRTGFPGAGAGVLRGVPDGSHGSRRETRPRWPVPGPSGATDRLCPVRDRPAPATQGDLRARFGPAGEPRD